MRTRPQMPGMISYIDFIVFSDTCVSTSDQHTVYTAVCIRLSHLSRRESETKLVLPAEVGGLQLKKQYKYGKVLLWKYVRPMADAAEEEGEA